MISCPLCPKSFTSREYLKYHMVSHTKEKPYKCLMCSTAFGRASSLHLHVKYVHEGQKHVHKTKNCPLCSHKCRSYKLKDHLRTHFAQLPISCSIFGCGFKTKLKKTLQQHFSEVHFDERPYECLTDGCNYKGKSKKHLSEHIKVHSSEKFFSCQVPGCKYTGKFQTSLNKHTRGVHGTEKRFQCSTCDFRTKHRSSLILHQRAHGNVKHFKCQAPNCGYASHQKQALEYHFACRHQRKDILCTELGCKFRCGSTAVLKMHLTKHELSIFQCPGDSCNFRTGYRRSLMKHISRFHQNLQQDLVGAPGIFDKQVAETTGALDTLHCTFPNCGYQTKYPHKLDRHKITHNEDKKCTYVCHLCFSRFNDSYGLKIHIQIHIGEQPYSCLLCSYTTGITGQLRAHARNIHQVYVIPRGKEKDIRTCRTCNANCSSYSDLVLHSMSHLRAVVVLERLDVKVG